MFRYVRIMRDTEEASGAGTGTVIADTEQQSFMDDIFQELPPEIDPDTIDMSTGLPKVKEEEKLETKEEIKEEVKEEKKEDKSEPIEKKETTEQKEDKNPLEDVVESLRHQIIAMSEQLTVDPKLQKVQEEVTTEDKKIEDQTKTTLENFLTPEELDRVIDEPALINLAFQRALTSITGNIQQNISSEVNRQILVNREITNFFTLNKDLLPYAKFVRYTLNEMEAKHGDKTYGEIFDETATECRKRLGLSAPEQTRETNKDVQRPAFVGSRRGNARPASGDGTWFDPSAKDIFDIHD